MALLGVVALVAGVVAATMGTYLGWVLWSQRRAGAPGLLRTAALTCPKCGGSFEYRFVPGTALTAVRFGSRRYVACPLCHRWSIFPFTGAGR
jgi:uncharacterized iron-regulated membrane protein